MSETKPKSGWSVFLSITLWVIKISAIIFVMMLAVAVRQAIHDNPGSIQMPDITAWLDDFPATKVFFIVATILMVIFAIPLWKKLTKKGA